MKRIKSGVFFPFLLLLSAQVYAKNISETLDSLFPFREVPVSNEILDPDIAFRITAEVLSNNQLLVHWKIEPGYYLYRDKFSITAGNTDILVDAFTFPAGKIKDDPVFDQVEVYDENGNVHIPFQIIKTGQKNIILNVGYQGCKEHSVCYPPIKKTITASLHLVNEKTKIGENLPSTHSAPRSTQDLITEKLGRKSFLLNIISFFFFGFLLSLTPCVFPMIPILSGIIVGQAGDMNKTKAIALSLSYVVAMALTYAVLGVIAGLFSINLQAASQNPWILILFSGVFIMLALSMFGFYNLQIPASWQSRLSGASTSSNTGTLKGAAVMGAISAIIVGPCVSPPLAGALLYINQTGNALFGGIALFFMGLGFGVPLLVVGATSGELLPRAGAWMETIKRTFGVMMLGVAIWFLERILPASVGLLLWALLLITVATFIGALDRIETTTPQWKKLLKGSGLLLLVYGVILVAAAAVGTGNVLHPFKQFSLEDRYTTEKLPFQPIASVEELDRELLLARRAGQIVMLDFYADWCVVCNELEVHTFSDPLIQKALQSVRLIKADVTENNQQHKVLLEQFGLFGPPAILFFNKEGQEIKSHRLIGFIKAKPFSEHIRQVISL